MHARFGHQEEAFNALNEAIMMAQEGKKYLCLKKYNQFTTSP